VVGCVDGVGGDFSQTPESHIYLCSSSEQCLKFFCIAGNMERTVIKGINRMVIICIPTKLSQLVVTVEARLSMLRDS